MSILFNQNLAKTSKPYVQIVSLVFYAITIDMLVWILFHKNKANPKTDGCFAEQNSMCVLRRDFSVVVKVVNYECEFGFFVYHVRRSSRKDEIGNFCPSNPAISHLYRFALSLCVYVRQDNCLDSTRTKDHRLRLDASVVVRRD